MEVKVWVINLSNAKVSAESTISSLRKSPIPVLPDAFLSIRTLADLMPGRPFWASLVPENTSIPWVPSQVSVVATVDSKETKILPVTLDPRSRIWLTYSDEDPALIKSVTSAVTLHPDAAPFA